MDKVLKQVVPARGAFVGGYGGDPSLGVRGMLWWKPQGAIKLSESRKFDSRVVSVLHPRGFTCVRWAYISLHPSPLRSS